MNFAAILARPDVCAGVLGVKAAQFADLSEGFGRQVARLREARCQRQRGGARRRAAGAGPEQVPR